MKRIITRSATASSAALDQSILNVIESQEVSHNNQSDYPPELLALEGVIEGEEYADEMIPASLLCSTADCDESAAIRVRDVGPVPDLSEADQNDGWMVDSGLPSTWDPVQKPLRGPKWSMNTLTPIDFFDEVLTPEITDYIVQETNRFITATGGNQHGRTMQQTCQIEIQNFIGILIWTGIEQKPAYIDHWIGLSDSPVPACMTLNRFKQLLSAIHFANNSKLPPVGIPGHDPYGKARPILEFFVERWRELYNTGVYVSGDESLNGFMGRLHYIQYIKSKHTRWGIKHFICSCAISGYVTTLIPYTGCDPEGDRPEWAPFLPTEKWALRLTETLAPGHIILFDNWFASPLLFQFLASQMIGAIGTVRRNRQGLPSTMKEMPKLLHPVHYRKKDVLLSVFSDKDKLISICSTTSEARNCLVAQRDRQEKMKVKFVEKPESSVVYNKAMIGVDLMDQKAHPYKVFPHRTTRWFHREFYRFLEITLVNGYILYRTYPHNTMSAKQFRKKIALTLMQR